MRQRKAGFTLVELLSVVAIMVIVAVVAIPGTMTLLRSLKMMELDETAKEIYLTAQNRLTARKAAGTLSAVGGDESPANSGLYWIESTDPKMAKLLPEGSLEAQTEDGTFVIWYNADTATVGEVYFTERGTIMPGLSVLQTMRYSDYYVQPAEAGEDPALSDLTPKELRREKKVGYYNGEESGLGIGAGDEVALLPPLLEIINEDELIVRVTVPDYANYLNLGVRLKVTVEELDADGNLGASQVLCDGQGYNGTADPSSTVVSAEAMPTPGVWTGVLDSLSRTKDGAAMAANGSNRVSFKSTCPGVTPGANIRVTATLTADPALAAAGVYDSSKVYFSGSLSKETNSLFESRQLVEDTSVDPAVTKDTVQISRARHLQNLEATYSTEGGSFLPASGIMPHGRLYIEQTGDIVWPSTAEYQSIGDYWDTLAEFNGNEYEIRELRGSNGLFCYAMNVDLEHIRIVNPTIVNNEWLASVVGALAGWVVGTSEASPAAVTDCRVYLSVPEETTVGGAVKVTERIDQYPNYGIRATQPTSYVGGLIGTAQNVSICDSFTSLHTVEGAGTVGGLVGCLETKVKPSTGLKDMEHCYASVTQLTGTPVMAAGLIGQVADPGAQVSQCFASANIAALRSGSTDGISGFANGDAISATDSYCAVTYNGADGTPTGVRPDYGFANGGTEANCAYLLTGAAPINSGGADQSVGLTFEELKAWKPGVFATVTDGERMALTHPYVEERKGKAYPFPMIVEMQEEGHPTIPFYGYWPETADDLLLAYYEYYADGRYGFYAEGINGGTAISTLSDTKAVKEDGYAILSVNSVSDGKLAFTYERGDGSNGSAETRGSVSGFSLHSPMNGSTAVYHFAYLIRPDWLNSTDVRSVSQAYTKLTCNGTKFWLIPEFARTAKNVSAPANPESSTAMELRTARQLAAVSQNAFWWSHCQLEQTRNIDFASYDPSYQDSALTFYPIGTNTNPFTTSYNAVSGWITGLGIEKDSVNYVGLFGFVGSAGKLDGITFLSDPEKNGATYTDSRNITGMSYVGALAGWNEGTITNCAVAGFDVSGHDVVGGFVGKNLGTISQCEAANGHFAVKTLVEGSYQYSDNPVVGGSVKADASTRCGGFVGENGQSGTSGTIQNCYAVVRMTENSGTGGFVGSNTSGTIDSAYCIAVGVKDTGYGSDVVDRDYLQFFGSYSGTLTQCYSLGETSETTTKTYEDLKTLFSGADLWKRMKQKADGITYHYSTEPGAADAFYPFPTAVTRGGKPAHYGNWPLY